MFITKKVPKFSIILISIAIIMFVFISINYISNHLFSNIDSNERIEYCQRINLDKIHFIHDDVTCNNPNNAKECQYRCPGWHSDKKYNRSGYEMEYYIPHTDFTSSSKNISIVPAHASITDLQNMVGSLTISIDSLLDCKLHPLPPLTKTNDNSTLILGTDMEGRDIFRLLSFSIVHSLQFAFLTLFSFLLSGMSSGILLGYYSNQYSIISSIANYINKSLESVPLLLWILLSLYALLIFLPSELQHDFAWPILFIILGQVSSPALSKMIRLKFIKLADDEFVVALKMLGLSNNKIIFNHIIPYYCLPIIFSQCAYIFAQALFLDITLTYLNVFFNEKSIGYRFIEARNTISDYGYGYFIITSIIIFFIIAFMFSLIRLIDSYNE